MFGVLVPFAFQLLILPRADLVTLFAAQGAADQLRKHPDDPAAAEARALLVVDLFGGDAVLRDVDVELSVVDGRAVAVASARARAVVPGFLVPMRSRATGPVEGFRPDEGTTP